MITGSVRGFSNRNHFVDYLNDKYGKYVQTIQVGKRLSNVDYLIMDSPDSVVHPKYETAMRAGIPILSSEEYTQKIESFVAYILVEEGIISWGCELL